MFQSNRSKIKNIEPEQMPMVNEKQRIHLRRTSSVCNDDQQIKTTQRCRRKRIQQRSDTVAIL